MKKIGKIGKVILIFTLLAIIVTGVACSSVGKSFDMPGEKQNTDHVVYGNGSQAIQYGNYVYFVNGYSGYEDEDGNQNKDVEKGAIYRAELYSNGKVGQDFEAVTKKEYNNYTDDYIYANNITDGDYEWIAHTDKDYDDKDVDVVTVNRLGNKRVGTSGYKTGGMFIFDDYIYYSTPSNEKDKSGAVVYKKTEFYRSRLDGKKTERIYKSNNDTDSSPYAFYKQDDKVYLALLDGSDIISVASGKSVGKPVKIATDVTSAVLPFDSTYYNGYNTTDSGKGKRLYTANDYIFFTRDADNDDLQKTGNVLEMIRPSGAKRYELSSGSSVTIDSVRDGMLFYTTNVDGQPVMKYTNAKNAIGDDDSLEEDAASGDAIKYATGEFNSFYAFRPNMQSSSPFVLGSNASGITFVDGTESMRIYSGTATVLFVKDRYVYFLDSDNNVRRTIFDKSINDKTDDEKRGELLSDQTVNVDALQVSVMNNYLVYIGKVDEWADNYTFFKKINLSSQNGESKELFVGSKIEADIKPEDDEDETEA